MVKYELLLHKIGKYTIFFFFFNIKFLKRVLIIQCGLNIS